MTVIDLFEQLGVLKDVRWKLQNKPEHTVRIDRREGSLIYLEVELALANTWIPDKPMPVDEFLKAFRPQR